MQCFLLTAQPVTKCIFETFRVEEYFWTQKQCCITQKVGIEEWCLFFDFVCFSGCHFTSPDFAKIGHLGFFFLMKIIVIDF